MQPRILWAEMPTRFFQFRKAIVGYCMPTLAVFVVKNVGLHNYFLPFQGNPVVAESCLRETRNGCTASGTAVNKLSWKAGALTIVLHLRSPSVEIVSLVRIPQEPLYVKHLPKVFYHLLSDFFT